MYKHKHFFIVGAQRSGTTFLYKVLDQHQDICMARPMKPEPKYFLNEDLNYSYETYLETLFSHRSNEKLLGEKGTSYLEYPFSGERIHSYFPDAKILITLRNPIYRALSNYFFSVNNGIENRSLAEVFIENKTPPTVPFKVSVSPFDYLKRGQYIDYIIPYVKPFNKENVGIFFFDEFIKDQSNLNLVFNFLDLEAPTKIELKKVNESNQNESVSIEILEFLKDYYKPHNERLSNYLDKDLSFWNIK